MLPRGGGGGLVYPAISCVATIMAMGVLDLTGSVNSSSFKARFRLVSQSGVF